MPNNFTKKISSPFASIDFKIYAKYTPALNRHFRSNQYKVIVSSCPKNITDKQSPRKEKKNKEH